MGKRFFYLMSYAALLPMVVILNFGFVLECFIAGIKWVRTGKYNQDYMYKRCQRYGRMLELPDKIFKFNNKKKELGG